jgi:hypothetical protein
MSEWPGERSSKWTTLTTKGAALYIWSINYLILHDNEFSNIEMDHIVHHIDGSDVPYTYNQMG